MSDINKIVKDKTPLLLVVSEPITDNQGQSEVSIRIHIEKPLELITGLYNRAISSTNPGVTLDFIQQAIHTLEEAERIIEEHFENAARLN